MPRSFVKKRLLLHALWALGLLLAASGCESTPRWPQGPVELATYSNRQIGFSISYPSACTIEESARGVLFRHEGAPIMRVDYVTENEGRRRGLWPGHDPVSTVDVVGRYGKQYDYDHYDGPIHTRTVAYVVPHRGRYLGVEFRVGKNAPGELQRQILASLLIDD